MSTERPEKQCCATCQYWQGERRIKFVGREARVEYSSAGVCGPKKMNRSGNFGSGCTNYKPWGDM